MRDVHKIALIGIVYAIILSLVVLIFWDLQSPFLTIVR